MTDSPAAIVAFEASLASRGDCLKIDAEGEATLTLAIPASEAPSILGAYSSLQDRTFHVVIVEAP